MLIETMEEKNVNRKPNRRGKTSVEGLCFLLMGILTLMVCGLTPVCAATAETVTQCIDRFSAKMSPTGGVSRESLWDSASLCQTLGTAQRSADEQQIREDNLVFQRFENQVLMWMVVSITLAGVVLAGAQLWASYLLAKSGRGALAEGGSVDFSKDKMAVQSSVVGVVVLAVSFAFFLVFVLYVYTFQGPENMPNASRDVTPHQISPGAAPSK